MERLQSDPAWFEVWFDSPHYHQLYGHRSDAEAAAFIRAMHQAWQWDHLDLLDLACGQGRHARAAAELGHRVVGLDLSSNSIAEATSRHSGIPNLAFVEGDMRSFSLDRSFNGILNLFTSFGYFDRPEDHVSVLQCMARHLHTGGFLVLDFLDAAFTLRHLQPEDKVEREGVEYTLQRRVESGGAGQWDTIVKTIRHTGREGEVRHEERVAALTDHDLSTMLHEAGFEVVGRYGNYSLEPWSEGETPRLILHAMKR